MKLERKSTRSPNRERATLIAITIWTPPGANLGDLSGPTADPRMVNFIGGVDDQGHPRPMTYQRLRQRADQWAITETTPDGPARLLTLHALCLAHGISCAVSIRVDD
jgi:hypothetical protein